MNIPEDIKEPILIKLRSGLYILADKGIFAELSSGVQKTQQAQQAPASEKEEAKIEGAKTEEAKGGIRLADAERAVLSHINQLKFEQRIPEKVRKMLSSEENRILDSLIRKEYVTVYKRGKYAKTGVLSISDKVYKLLSAPAKTTSSSSPSQTSQSSQASQTSQMRTPLDAEGCLIVSNEEEAKQLSAMLEKEIRAGNVLGIRGFDKKYYIIKRAVFEPLRSKILSILDKEDMTFVGIAKTLEEKEDKCLCALNLLIEEGDIIEKKKGLYSLV